MIVDDDDDAGTTEGTPEGTTEGTPPGHQRQGRSLARLRRTRTTSATRHASRTNTNPTPRRILGMREGGE